MSVLYDRYRELRVKKWGPWKSPICTAHLCFPTHTFPPPEQRCALPPNPAQILSMLSKDFPRPELSASVSAALLTNSSPTASPLFSLCSQSPLPILANAKLLPKCPSALICSDLSTTISLIWLSFIEMEVRVYSFQETPVFPNRNGFLSVQLRSLSFDSLLAKRNWL